MLNRGRLDKYPPKGAYLKGGGGGVNREYGNQTNQLLFPILGGGGRCKTDFFFDNWLCFMLCRELIIPDEFMVSVYMP